MYASASMVSVGLNPLIDGKVDEPTIKRLWISQLWPYLFTTDVLGSFPMRVPPS
jgi:hypothetical protein